MATEHTPPQGPARPESPPPAAESAPLADATPQGRWVKGEWVGGESALSHKAAAEVVSAPASTPEPGGIVPGRWVAGEWVIGERVLAAGTVAAVVSAPAPAVAQDEPDAGLHLRGITIPFRWEVAAYLAILFVALTLRLWDLGARAIHHDESLHAYFSWQVYNGNGYLHNPLTHGMFIFHSTAGAFFLFGDSDFTARLPEALLGSVLVLIPWLMRPRLGTVGALAASLMLAFSPALLFFSRFAREDILVAPFLLGVVAMVWRYLDEGRHRYLYGAAACLALAFTTKETTFIFVAIMSGALLAFGWSDVTRWVWGRGSIKDWKRPASALVIIAGVSLPMFGAGLAIFQDGLNITLAAKEGTPGVATGAPQGTGMFVAGLITFILIGVSMAVGLMWRRRVWLISTAIFAAIFIALYSNFLTHPTGVATGIWQSLGYWLSQHGVKRGDQPWYYYFILTSLYEFLPMLLSVGAVFYYALRKRGTFTWLLAGWAVLALITALVAGTTSPWPWAMMGVLLFGMVPFMPADRFIRFLVFWASATFLGFSIAGEKMPWLEVHVTLPLIILAARVINDVVNTVTWRKAWKSGAWLAIPGVPLFVLLIYRLTLVERWRGEFWELWAILAGAGLLLLGLWALAGKLGWRPALGVVTVVAAGCLFLLTLRAGFVAAYRNGDVPREMLVYTQTSPALHSLVQEIREAGRVTGDREKIKVSIDSTSGFTWPWAWYLRNYTDVSYVDYSGPDVAPANGSKIVIVHRNNNARISDRLKEAYEPARLLPHRWWFPENETYKGLTAGEFGHAVVHPDQWDKYVDFFLYRKLPPPFGSEDSYVYFSKELPPRPFD